jgi:hypothetical protein
MMVVIVWFRSTSSDIVLVDTLHYASMTFTSLGGLDPPPSTVVGTLPLRFNDSFDTPRLSRIDMSQTTFFINLYFFAS